MRVPVCCDAQALRIRNRRDGPVEIRSQHSHAVFLIAIENRGVRLAKNVSLAHGDHRDSRRDRGQKLIRRRSLAPVMRHLQNVRGQGIAVRDNFLFSFLFDVAREQESRASGFHP